MKALHLGNAFTVRRVATLGTCALDLVVVHPDQQIPAHYHERSESVIFPLSSRGVASLGSRRVGMHPLHPLRIRKGIVHAIEGAAAPVRFLALTTPALPIDEANLDYHAVSPDKAR